MNEYEEVNRIRNQQIDNENLMIHPKMTPRPAKALTAEERAKKIQSNFELSCCPDHYPETLKWLTSQIREAEQEARRQAIEEAAQVCLDSIIEHPSTEEESGWVECTKTPMELAVVVRAMLDEDIK